MDCLKHFSEEYLTGREINPKQTKRKGHDERAENDTIWEGEIVTLAVMIKSTANTKHSKILPQIGNSNFQDGGSICQAFTILLFDTVHKMWM